MNEFVHGAACFLGYVIPMAVIFLTARALVKIPNELFRKILHFILLGAYIPLVFAFQTWWKASALALGLIGVFYPVLALAEKLPAYGAFITQRKKGEIKNSMILALTMMALSTCVCWGIFGDRYLVLACVYAWGVGDAFAAIVGKQFGKHKFRVKFADPHKSVEGTIAMFLSSGIAVTVVLLVRGGLGFGSCLLIAMAASAVTASVELCTRGGFDTFTCPAAAMVVILPLIRILGG